MAMLLAVQVGSAVFLPIAHAQSSEGSSPEQTQPSLVVGVVRSPNNANAWQAIVNRLESASVAYQVVDWHSVTQDTMFTDISVLFLPDVTDMSAEQLLALQNWINRGGGLIVSGPVGSEASAGIQQALSSLLGAYWGTPLSQPVRLEPIVLNRQPWLREGDVTSEVQGGTLVPTGMASQSIATWNAATSTDSTPASTVAIVTTRQTIYLGWRWGTTDSGAAFDSQWLSAALSHFQNMYPPIAVTPSASPAAPPAPTRPQPTIVDRRSSQPPSFPLPAATAPAATAPAATVQDNTPTFRPDQQAAPPGLVVESGDQPISLVEAIAMRQELENLIGRFESALLAAESATSEIALQTASQQPKDNEPRSDAPELSISASADSSIPLATDLESSENLNQILQTAKAQLSAFSEALRQQNYATARESWLEARQLLWQNFPTDRPIAPTEVRAIWLDRETIVNARSPQGLAEIFDRLAAAGINTVFFETVNAGYPIYPSQVAPQQNPLTRHWDPLEAAVELAHDRNMELHAWVWTFAAGNEAHNHILNINRDYPGPILAEHPDWANFDNRGELLLPGHEEPFLDPANPAVRRYLSQLFEEIVTRYDVDGLQLDYIRYPFQNPSARRTQGYGTAARQQFQQLTGVDPITLSPGRTAAGRSSQQDLWQQWTEFRVSQINSFVAETASTIRQLRPEVVLSVAVFALPEQERIQKIQQNWEVWAQRGDVDMIVLMTYAADTNRLQQLATPWLTEATTNLGSALVLPSIRILNLPDAVVFDQIQALRDLPSGGYSLFATAHLHDNLQGILNRTQGTNPSEPIPYRQPFAAAAARFTALQREWSYLLTQNQLWMHDAELAEWQAQTTAIQAALTELEDNPSQAKLQQTNQLLQAYQASFADWMSLQSISHGYRVRAWQNRLATIQTLIDYGDRVVLERDL
ncbi:MAG: hypothetical protein Kow00121_03170 [Elainellaceae cyanobacterium]